MRMHSAAFAKNSACPCLDSADSRSQVLPKATRSCHGPAVRFLLSLLPVVAIAACAGSAPAKSTLVSTSERDAPLPASEGAIGGMVRDSADGLPLSMVIVQVEADGKIIAEDVSDYKGVYRVGPLAPGNYRVSARFANARVVYESVVVHASSETNVQVGIDLRVHSDRETKVQSEGKFGAISGVVLDEVDGNTFPGTVVSLQAKHLPDAVMAISDAEGRFRFKSLRPGIYNLSCYYQLVQQGNVEIRRGNIVVAPGETTDVQLQLDLTIR